MKQLKNIFFILILSDTIGQFFSDLYLPSIPAMSKSLSVSVNTAQLTISVFMLGYCISSFWYGSISDTFGRKKPLLMGLILCFFGSVICAISTDIYSIIIGRLLQGLGAGSGMTVTPAIVRDCVEGKMMAKFSSYLTFANIIVIMIAPLIGGYLQKFFNWQASFYFLLIYAFAVLILVFAFLPETKQPEHRSKFNFSTYKDNIFELLSSRQFLGYMICLFASYGGILAWLTVGPVLMQEYLFLTPEKFGWICILEGIGYGLGALLNARLVTRFGIHNMLNVGTFFMIVGGVLMLILAWISYFNVFVIMLPLVCYMFGSAMIFPNSYAGALGSFLKIAGVASAILGGCQILGGYVSSMLMAFLPDDSQVPLALVLIACSIAIFLSKKFMIIKTT